MSTSFIKADQRLQRLVGTPPKTLPHEVGQRAEAAIAGMSDEADIAIREQIDRLWQMVESNDALDETRIDQVFFIAHDLRGLCASVGHSTPGLIADALCTYIDEVREAGFQPRSNILWLHVSSLKRATEEETTNALGQYLIESLCALRKKELKANCAKDCTCSHRPQST